MAETPDNLFAAFLNQHDTAAWTRTRDALRPSIQDVDRDATDIWFHFFPLKLAQAFAQAGDPAKLARDLRLEGNYLLTDQVDSSHWFLYGHRFWPKVKTAIMKRLESTRPPASVELADIVRDLAKEAATSAGADASLLLGIVAVGVMTLQQVGIETFRSTSRDIQISKAQAGQDTVQVIAARRKNDRQGLAGFFRGIKSQYTVTFDERRKDGRFTIINHQHLTTASASDKRDYSSYGSRTCVEGPIPVQCRTASCGTCWVGVLGGAERLSDVDEMEARRMKEFGYVNSREPKPIVRLACSAIASGNVTLVIPPWNGFLGKAGLGDL